MFGRKSLCICGFMVFSVCGAAPTRVVLVCFGGIQALGAAMMQVNSVAIGATAGWCLLPRSRDLTRPYAVRLAHVTLHRNTLGHRASVRVAIDRAAATVQ